MTRTRCLGRQSFGDGNKGGNDTCTNLQYARRISKSLFLGCWRSRRHSSPCLKAGASWRFSVTKV
jgi:hypothetical protein